MNIGSRKMEGKMGGDFGRAILGSGVWSSNSVYRDLFHVYRGVWIWAMDVLYANG